MNGQKGREAEGQRSPGPSFRSQIMWRKAQDLAESVTLVINSLPQNRAANVIATQLMRSASSIAANIAEGYGRYSQAAYRNHLSIARGSALETESWVDLLLRSKYITNEQATMLFKQCDEIERLLTSRMKTLDQGKTYAIKEEADFRYGVE